MDQELIITCREKGLECRAAADDGRRRAPEALARRLAARRLCSTTAHKRARVGGSEAAQGRREREGSLAALP